MTHLASFLAASGIKQSKLADEIKISRSYMSELASGEKSPGRVIALAIERATNGAVPVSSWGEV